MSIFGNRNRVAVASVSYNLAGDDDPVNYLQSSIFNSIIYGSASGSIADDLKQSYLGGPGLRIRNFPRWAERTNYYNVVGHATSVISSNVLNTTLLAPLLPYNPAVETIRIDFATIDSADISYWAEQYLVQNNPGLVGSPYAANFDQDTQVLTITMVDANDNPTGVVFTTTITNLDSSIPYIYALFTKTSIATHLENGVQVPNYIIADYFIYGMGQGNTALDALFPDQNATSSTFYPLIPFRINNRRVNAANFPQLYPLAKTGFSKATGQRYEDMMKVILDNPSVGDIDYAYIIFGVAINTKDNEGKRYIFEFFERMYNQFGAMTPTKIPVGTESGFAAFIRQDNYYMRNIFIRSLGYAINYNITISWAGLQFDNFIGVWKTGAKVHESDLRISGNQVLLYYQRTETTYDRIIVTELTHVNTVYDNKSVRTRIGSYDDDERDYSNLIIPLQESVFRELGLVRETQLVNSCVYVTFNCYEKYKLKWYQTNAFKFVVMVAIIVIIVVVTYFTWGTGTPAASKFGAAVMAALMAAGMSAGTAAFVAFIIVTMAKMLIGLLLAKLLTMGAKKLFGDKWGEIIGAIAAMATMVVLGSLDAGTTFSGALASLSRADVLLSLTLAGTAGYTKYMDTQTRDFVNQSQKMLEEYNREVLYIQERQKDLFKENLLIDPLAFTSHTLAVYENLDSFLGRTLMTGSDVCEITLGMIDNFTTLTLDPDINSAY